ncbi:benzoyl-CoA 2,3-epoxidase subunit BoxA [Maritimibacter sp. UBA3975]|uniref:benzoyl-CoA 2,3-epoxidase subunit BoxA n=1 Tax=Maritimibacter sp. UBA3975 TaxID=1946833 RepID=UPI000C095774|nr:benzoyl-CoA 2,3-epoxidase subunit BoxA [Maritimibacter sp. UBA3975]MAM63125.1 benzoyl-CoA 2,3-epoxidase subunit BoxA [Maritimibacter sp.]|tara:strand:+ start:13971 stop:15164 length:1194 start_codon:yes stop_codon:yes gene_type:complete
MNKPLKQHLIDPEICIRCYTCEMTCPIEAITHNDDNVVVDAEKCNFCMDCIPVCPTGSIDEWRVVNEPYSLDEQFEWTELPEQGDVEPASEGDGSMEALDEAMAALLAEAHAGAGGKSVAPKSASKATVNLYNLGKPVEATVQGNYRLTAEDSDADVRHIILDFGAAPMPVLEGQSIGIIPPGEGPDGKAHLPRLYSVSSPRDGERPGYNNISLTVKREEQGVCSNYVCDLKKGDKVRVTGPFGSTFLLPSDPDAELLMICTGTGSAPFRGFTMRRQRDMPSNEGKLTLVFGARKPGELPYFGPLKKVPEPFMRKVFAFSRLEDQPKHYVQDKLREEKDAVGKLLSSDKAHIYICGKKEMEHGVEEALADIARAQGQDWTPIRDRMREEGRYHVETY